MITPQAKKANDLPPFPVTSQLSIFLITFWNIVCLHITRKSFSMVKSIIIDLEWFKSSLYTSQSEMCGLLDTVFLFAYAFGLFLSGSLADSYNLRIFIFWGMVLSGLTSIIFGMAGFLNIRSISVYCIIWAINGLIQSSGYPANLAVMGRWYGSDGRGLIIGIWSGNGSFGNIVGAGVCSIILMVITSDSLSWKLCMILSALILIGSALPVYRSLVPNPVEIGLPDPNTKTNDSLEPLIPPAFGVAASTGTVSSTSVKNNIYNTVPTEGDEEETHETIWERIVMAWFTPGVAQYAISFACLKGVNYALLFWLPYYLSSALGYSSSKAGFYSILYDVGQLFGGFTAGWITDKLGQRAPTTCVMIIINAFIVWGLQFTTNTGQTAFILFASGFFMGGPTNLIQGCIATDLGHISKKSLLATVTGVIDGTGSIGAALMQYTIGYLTTCASDDDASCSWRPVFILLLVGDLMSAILLSRVVYKEIFGEKSKFLCC